MEVISIDELCELLGKNVSQKVHDEVLQLIRSCEVYELRDEADWVD